MTSTAPWRRAVILDRTSAADRWCRSGVRATRWSQESRSQWKNQPARRRWRRLNRLMILTSLLPDSRGCGTFPRTRCHRKRAHPARSFPTTPLRRPRACRLSLRWRRQYDLCRVPRPRWCVLARHRTDLSARREPHGVLSGGGHAQDPHPPGLPASRRARR